ncbi:MAG: hypothetical protein M1831_003596 [Alyxoria varia]|nr:MAG: hypothetical protein M1831_003596 [Alyxoria varia]
MGLTILNDEDVKDVLDSLTKEDVEQLHHSLADAMHSYSTAVAPVDSDCCASNQPERMHIKLRDGATTLFMPALSDGGMGVKIVTLNESSDDHAGLPTPVTDGSASPMSSRTPRSSSPSSISTGNPRSSSPSIISPSVTTASSASMSSRKDSGDSSRNSTSSRTQPIRKPSSPVDTSSSNPSGKSTSPSGTITLLSPEGNPRALISASTLTAFRTALASTLLFRIRRSVHTLTVFGAGHQAFWHIYLALLTRGPEIHHLHVINRDFGRAQNLYMALGKNRNPVIQEMFMGGKLRPSILTPEYGEYSRLLKEYVRACDVMFCCTPSVKPLFPATYLTNTEGRKKARYIAAVGSYKPHLLELPVELLQQAVEGPYKESTHKHGPFQISTTKAGEGGAVIVDTIDGAMKEAGEIIQAGVGANGVVELGELVMLKRSHKEAKEQQARERREQEKRREKEELRKKKRAESSEASVSSSNAEDSAKEVGSKQSRGFGKLFGHLRGHSREGKEEEPKEEQKKEKQEEEHVGDGGLFDWLTRGNVIYKSVGIGLMDVVVGMEIVKLAEERKIGTVVEDFP